MTLAEMKNVICRELEALGPRLDAMSLEMYQNPELGDCERRASALHAEALREYGFDVTMGVCSRETGFRAVYSRGEGVTAALLVEYDALPEIGHGCGHNISGCASTGAAIALKALMQSDGGPSGTVVVLGAPAEETNGAKVEYARSGVFDGVDFAMMAHASDKWMRSGTSLALTPLCFEFYGRSSHASSMPERGVNAADAGMITMAAVNALRQHILSDSRVHGVILQAGNAANIVPDYCKMQFYVRSADKDYNDKLVERVKNCARAGALATGARLVITPFETPMANLRTNEALSRLFCDSAREAYSIDITQAKHGGSSDMGDVSLVCPAIHPYFDITNGDGSANHTRERADCTVTPYAREQMRTAAGILCITAARAMSDTEALREIKDEFLKR